MILPDDKDPDIVWDEQKCWVDKNAAPGEAENRMAAPPSDTSFGGKPSPLSSKPGENRFQLSKQRSLRKHYVDVLNPNSNKASSDSPSAPAVAAFPEQSAAQPPAQFFVPPAVGEQHDGSSGYEFVSPAPLPDQTAPAPPPPPEAVPTYQPSAKAVSTPMMFDPADFSSRAVDSSHKAAGGNLARRRAYPT
ncbi:protein transport protein Sec16A-like [Dermacentor albipictus]|uniref:protein transport protein Sec16A-like n=1 Tax=Dermacentor albipictus TaxID=60249 RepID=UPI0038FC8EAE